MINFDTIVPIALKVFDEPSEHNIEAFLQLINKQPEPDNILEHAMLEAISDLTMHEYVCHAMHEKEAE